MTWRDRFNARGRFRDAEFVIESDALAFGRRTVLHEYPERDLPYVEDLGRKAREFSVELYVLGADYDRARDRLVAALEEPGPGTLVHPYFGTMRVAVTAARKRETTRNGGYASFTVTFVEAGALTFPSSVVDTADRVEAAVVAAQADLVEDFAESFSVQGQAQYFVAAIEEELHRSLAGVINLVGDVAGPIAAMIRTPYNMGAAILGAVGEVASAAGEPGRALRLYETLFDSGNDSPGVPTTTAARRRQARNAQALHQLLQRGAVVEACRAAAQSDFDARDDALGISARLCDALDAQMEATDLSGRPIDDTVYTRLAAVRAAVVEDLRTRGAQLPRITYYTAAAALPALVLAHRIHGDAARADEIVARNRVQHPGFVPGGEPLEVLRDE